MEASGKIKENAMSLREPTQSSLQVTVDQKVIFSSDGKWLYPLFDLMDFMDTHPISMAEAFVRDKVVGKAAALLLVRMGAGRVHGELMSELARETLTQFEVPHSFGRLVSRIDCKTESLLLAVDEPEKAYQILCQRAGRC